MVYLVITEVILVERNLNSPGERYLCRNFPRDIHVPLVQSNCLRAGLSQCFCEPRKCDVPHRWTGEGFWRVALFRGGAVLSIFRQMES